MSSLANLTDLVIGLRADPSGVQEGMSKGKALALAGGAAMGAAIAAGALKAMDMGAANDKLAAQLGLTEQESARVGKVAGSLYAGAYGESIEDVNVAVGAVMSSIKGMNKASSADLQGMTAKALDFAAAFEVDVQRAVDVAGRAVNAGLAKDADEAFDLITAASQRVPANLREDVLDATDEYGQFFAHLGIKGPQAFGIMVDAAEKGMFGIDKVGDAIKEFTILSTDGSQSTKDAFEAIGLNAKNMQTSILAGGDSAAGATQKIVDGLLGIKDPGKQAETALALFGTPLEDLNVKDIPEFLKTMRGGSDAMEGFAGATDRMGATLNDNASTNLTSFKRQAELAFVGVVGGAVIPTIEKAAKFLAYTLGPAITKVGDVLSVTLVPALKSTARFIADNEGPIKVVAGVIAGLLVPAFAVLAVNAAQTAARVVAGWVSQSVAAARSAASSVAALSRVALAWVRTGVQALASAARMAAAWLIAMGPIALVIAAVVGVVVLIIKNWDKIVAATKKAWEWIKSTIAKVWDAIKAGISAAVNAVKSAITGGFDLIRKGIQKYVDGWKAIITGAWDAIKKVVGGGITWIVDKITGMPGAISRAASGLFDGIKDAFRSAVNWIIGAWNNLEFRIPGFDPPGPGPKFGGFTLGLPDIPMLATGGPAFGGRPYIVGERGPEMFVPRSSGRVVPNDQLGGGDVYVTVEMDGQVFDARIKSVHREEKRKHAQALKAGARRMTVLP